MTKIEVYNVMVHLNIVGWIVPIQNDRWVKKTSSWIKTIECDDWRKNNLWTEKLDAWTWLIEMS